MGLAVTDVSFSLAKTIKSGSCGFCRVTINDAIAIHRVRVRKSSSNKYEVVLPTAQKFKGDNGSDKPIVQLLNKDVISTITDAVLQEYHQLIEENDGFYQKKSKFENSRASIG